MFLLKDTAETKWYSSSPISIFLWLSNSVSYVLLLRTRVTAVVAGFDLIANERSLSSQRLSC